MNFGQAMEVLKQGGKVERSGWNGKGLWVALCDGSPALDADKFWNPHARAYARANGGTCAVRPYMLLKTAQGDIQMGWAPSGPDSMADDWHEVKSDLIVLPPHQQRVIDERAELAGRADKLATFLDTPIFDGLHVEEQRRLRMQHETMTAYADILAARIVAFTA